MVKANPSIGYLYIQALSDELGGGAQLSAHNDSRDKIEEVLSYFNNAGVQGLIVDIRSQAGGSNYSGLFIANHFVNKSRPYMQERYFESPTTMKEKTWYVNPGGQHSFRTGKIVLLTNGLTCSGGEMFTLAMLQRDNLVHIGSRTMGCAGAIIDKDLPNGWNIRMPSTQTGMANGAPYYQVGISPQIEVRNPEGYGTTYFDDRVLLRAIQAF
jgi:carboxyl-terminal processing protease